MICCLLMLKAHAGSQARGYGTSGLAAGQVRAGHNNAFGQTLGSSAMGGQNFGYNAAGGSTIGAGMINTTLDFHKIKIPRPLNHKTWMNIMCIFEYISSGCWTIRWIWPSSWSK